MDKFSWNCYALIPELVKRFHTISPQCSKTFLQQIVFLLQEVYGIDCGYDFEFYLGGPYSSQLNGDLDLVQHWGCISVQRVNKSLDGYQICPTKEVDKIRVKAADFLNNQKTKTALESLIFTYGNMTVKDLELRASTIYVWQSFKHRNELCTKRQICHVTGQIKLKFSKQEIEEVVDQLSQLGHIQLSDQGS